MQKLTTTPYVTYRHAKYVLKKRWADIGKPEVEDVIGKNTYYAYVYACYILKQRWADIGKPEVEDVIKKSGSWLSYKRHFKL